MIKYGSDPEVFAIDSDGGVVPPVIFREELGLEFEENGRHPIFIRGDGFYVHEDGVAFEVGVTPSDTLDENLAKVQSAYQSLEELLSKYGYRLGILPAVPFDTGKWGVKPRWIRDCMIFGCDADHDAFDFNRKGSTVDAMKHPWRYGGGHLHVSGLDIFHADPVASIKVLASTVGLATVAFSDVTILEKQRTFLYGKPGKYRPQRYPDGSHGIEYRTPSNTWSRPGNPVWEPLKEYFDLALRILSGGQYERLIADFGDVVKDTIVEQRQDDAKLILSKVVGYA